MSTLAIEPIDLKPVESKLAEFSSFVQAIQVRDRDQYTAVTLRVKDAKQEIKKIGFVLDPGIASAKEHYDFLRNQKAAFVSKWQAQIDIGDGKATKWLEEDDRRRHQEEEAEQEKVNAAQRIKAEEERREQERIIAEQKRQREREIEQARKNGEVKAREAERLRKQAEADAARQRELADKQKQETIAATPTVEVQSLRPKIAGVPRTMHYYAEVNQPVMLLLAYEAAIRNEDTKRQIFLSRFLTVNEQEVGKYAREVKNSAKVMAELPGVTATNSY